MSRHEPEDFSVADVLPMTPPERRATLEAEADGLRRLAARPMPEGRIGFRITGGRGFHITFANGWTVSVQFGPGNYCDNYDDDFRESAESGARGSSTAEAAVWPANGQLVSYGDWGNTVGNRLTPTQILELLNWAASQPAPTTTRGDL